MINLVLDTNQSFSVGPTNNYRFQEWGFNPSQVHEVISFIGQAAPADLTIATQIKNYIASLGTGTYVKFYVDVELHFVSNVNSIAWFAASGVLPDATNNGYLLAENNLNVDTVLSFQNLDQMPLGIHEAYIQHNVKGELANGDLVFIEREDYYISLNRTNDSSVQVQPTNLDFFHLIGSALPAAQNLSLFAGAAFTVDVSDHFVLSGGNIVLDSNVDGIKTYSGTGNQTVTITLNVSIEAIGATINNNPSWFISYVWIRNATGESDQAAVKVYQYEVADYNVSPMLLTFVAIQGVLEATTQAVYIEGYGSYVATGPSWLTIGNASGDNNGILNVEPISSENLTPGVYNSEIVIVTTSGNLSVLVQHTVVGDSELGIDTTGINFTKDRSTISNFYGSDDHTVNINIDVLSYGYNILMGLQNSSLWKKGLFNNTTNFFLGKAVEKIMHKLKSLSDIGLDWLPDISGSYQSANGLPGGTVYKYYNPSITKLSYSFIERVTGLQIGSTETVFNIKFIKGRRPSRINDNYGILDYKESPIRVTENSVTFLNLYKDTGLNKIEILKNNVVVNTFLPENGNNKLFAMRLDFSNTTPGDVIEAKYYQNPKNNVKYRIQKYIVFDIGNYSYHIGWENEHGVLELFEFTGAYQFSTKRDEVIAKTFTNFLEQLNKYEANKELKFIANTGWILKSNQERIDDLENSSRAWIIFKEDRAPISLVPRAKKMINSDSELGQYEYQIEFTINPTHELENNTF